MFTLRTAQILFFCIFFAKLVIHLYLNFYNISLFGGGNDSVYYDSYARGKIDYAVNSWPVMLRYLNHVYLYDRFFVAFVLFLLSSITIPFLCARIMLHNVKNKVSLYKTYMWNFALVLSFYPTMFFLTVDIYRDSLMVMLFLFVVSLLQYFMDIKYLNFKKVIVVIVVAIITWVLSDLRIYLGVSIIASILVAPFIRLKGSRLFLAIIIYLFSISILYYGGGLSSILEYRDGIAFDSGGSTIGLEISNRPLWLFVPLFFYSFVVQIFGLYFPNITAILVFVLESLPFIFAFLYVIQNRRYLTQFTKYLLVFFMIYLTVWVLGNDNLGSATRLRIFNYISIYIVMGSIILRKKVLKN